MCLSLQKFILFPAKDAYKGNLITLSQWFLLCDEGLVSQKTFDAEYNKWYAYKYGKLLIINKDAVKLTHEGICFLMKTDPHKT